MEKRHPIAVLLTLNIYYRSRIDTSKLSFEIEEKIFIERRLHTVVKNLRSHEP
jgi:hypothetical protein